MNEVRTSEQQMIERERLDLLLLLEDWLETPQLVLAFLLSLYAFAVFGYVTAALATFFIGRDAEHAAGEVAGSQALEALRTEVAALRTEIRGLYPREQPVRDL
jgi:voltage-gated potassium channel